MSGAGGLKTGGDFLERLSFDTKGLSASRTGGTIASDLPRPCSPRQIVLAITVLMQAAREALDRCIVGERSRGELCRAALRQRIQAAVTPFGVGVAEFERLGGVKATG